MVRMAPIPSEFVLFVSGYIDVLEVSVGLFTVAGGAVPSNGGLGAGYFAFDNLECGELMTGVWEHWDLALGIANWGHGHKSSETGDWACGNGN